MALAIESLSATDIFWKSRGRLGSNTFFSSSGSYTAGGGTEARDAETVTFYVAGLFSAASSPRLSVILIAFGSPS